MQRNIQSRWRESQLLSVRCDFGDAQHWDACGGTFPFTPSCRIVQSLANSVRGGRARTGRLQVRFQNCVKDHCHLPPASGRRVAADSGRAYEMTGAFADILSLLEARREPRMCETIATKATAAGENRRARSRPSALGKTRRSSGCHGILWSLLIREALEILPVSQGSRCQRALGVL